MVSRSVVMAVTVALVAAGPLAGCLDKFFGRGELTIKLRVSDAPSMVVNGVNYVNAKDDFVTANMPVSQVKVWPVASREGDMVQALRHDVDDLVDLSGEPGSERDLVTIPMVAGDVEKVSVLTLPFNATLPNGSNATIAVIESPDLWEYVVEEGATVEAGETTVYVVSFMIARRADDTSGSSYFLALPPDQSGPR